MQYCNIAIEIRSGVFLLRVKFCMAWSALFGRATVATPLVVSTVKSFFGSYLAAQTAARSLVMATATTPATTAAPGGPRICFVFDLDGVVYHQTPRGNVLIPGSADALALLDQHKVPYAFVSNGTGQSEREKAATIERLLRDAGKLITVPPEKVMLCATPMRDLAKQYADRQVIVAAGDSLGESGTADRLAFDLGFAKFTSLDDFVAQRPHLIPRLMPAPTAELMARKTVEPIAACFILDDPNEWARSLQVLCDIAACGGAVALLEPNADQAARERAAAVAVASTTSNSGGGGGGVGGGEEAGQRASFPVYVPACCSGTCTMRPLPTRPSHLRCFGAVATIDVVRSRSFSTIPRCTSLCGHCAPELQVPVESRHRVPGAQRAAAVYPGFIRAVLGRHVSGCRPGWTGPFDAFFFLHSPRRIN